MTDTDSRYQYLKDCGNEKFKLKQFEAAKELYTEAIHIKKDEPIPYLNRAACNIHLRLFYDVIEDCDKALELDSRLSKAHYRRATALNELSRLNLARASYIKAAELDPECKSIKNELLKVESILKQNGRIDVKFHLRPDRLRSKKEVQTFELNKRYSGSLQYDLKQLATSRKL